MVNSRLVFFYQNRAKIENTLISKLKNPSNNDAQTNNINKTLVFLSSQSTPSYIKKRIRFSLASVFFSPFNLSLFSQIYIYYLLYRFYILFCIELIDLIIPFVLFTWFSISIEFVWWTYVFLYGFLLFVIGVCNVYCMRSFKYFACVNIVIVNLWKQEKLGYVIRWHFAYALYWWNISLISRLPKIIDASTIVSKTYFVVSNYQQI